MLRYAAFGLAILASGADAFSTGAFLPAGVRSRARVSAAASVRMVSEEALNRRSAMAAVAGLALALGQPVPVLAAGATKATFKINTAEGVKGDVVFELYPDKAPKTVAAFQKYAADGLYDETAFFRVGKFLNKGVLVGGDPFTKESKYCLKTIDGKEECSEGNGYGPDGFMSSTLRKSNDGDVKATRLKWGKGGPDGWRRDSISKVKLEPEFNTIPHEKGVITMRRFGNPDSAGSQFIICMGDMKEELDGHFAAFGKVTQGIDILEEIMKVNKQATKSESALVFNRDDKKPQGVWPVWDLPTSRQGIDKVIVE